MKFLSSILLLAGVALAIPQTAIAPPTATATTPSAGSTGAPKTGGTTPVSGAANPITFPLGDKPVDVGKPITITWQPTFGDNVDLVLRRGESDDLDDVIEIVKGVKNSGSYTWTPPAALEGGSDYAIQITSGASTNYSPQFQLDSEGKGMSTSAKPSATPTPSASPKASASSSKKEDKTSSEKESATPTASPSSTIRPAADTSDNSAANVVRSPLALLVGVVAALAYFN